MYAKLTIPERLKDLRVVDKHLTLEQLAEQTGLSKSALGKYETDDYKDISPFAIATLADFYGVSTDYLMGLTENKNHPNTELQSLHLSDDMVELLSSGKINNRLLCELAAHPNFRRLMIDMEICIDQIANMRVEQMNLVLEATRQTVMSKYAPGEDDLYMRTLELGQVQESDFYSHVMHDDLDSIVRDIREAHRNADIHIHDLSMLTGYCAGWSLKQLIKEGLGGITGKITSAPARHLSVLCNQMVNFLGIMQNEWAGAQAFSSFDTYLAPFVKVDHLSYPEVKKCIEAFIYGVNTPSRWGTQAPFSNITLDWTVPDDLAELPALVGGVEMDFKYKDCKKEMDMVNKAFIETMIEGDSNGRGFQYPIPTYSITKDFDWSDTENNRLLFEMTAKYGTPYFSNYINSDMQPSDVRSMCCRLRLDLRELRKKTGGFFGSGESTGSVGVVTINMPRIAYLSANKDEFYARLNHMMDIAARSLKIKRGVITKLLNEGLYPYTKRYLGTFENHFSTIGLIGMNEVGLNANWLRADMSDPRTQEFTKEVLNHMRERLSDYQEQYGDLYNLEATPAESTTYRLAKHDRKRWPGIKTAGKPGDTPYYTNSSHLPVDYTVDIFDALDIQDELQTLYTSGTVFHAFLGEKLPDWKAAASLVRTIASNYKLPYYTLSPTYSICKEHGYLAGEVKVCPHCGAKTEVYSRITGYYRPVQNWNDGKLQEYANRTEYDMDHSSLKRPTRSVVTLSNFAEDVEVKVEQPQDIKYLFTTKTCPNCKLVKEYLKNVPYVTIDAEENMELARRYGVMQAPTLVVVNGDSHKKYVNASNIKKYVDQLTLVGVE